MTSKQRDGMIRHHEKMERAFLRFGQTDNAKSARRLADNLKAERAKEGA